MRNSGAPFVIEMESLVLGYSQASPLNEPFSARLEGAGIHLIVGRNGAGKSTLIRTLAGLQAPLNGSIKWKGQLLSKASAKERGEGMAFMASTPPRTSGLRVLDAPSRTALRQTLLELSQTGVGMILASHDFHGLQGRDELTSIHALNASGWNALDRLHQATDWESQL